MKTLASALMAVAVFVFFPVLSGSGYAQTAAEMGPCMEDLGFDEHFMVLLGDNKDLNGCQQDCRSKFGLEPYAELQRGLGFPSRSPGAYYAYAECIAECNRKFWKAFDTEMDNLEKSK